MKKIAVALVITLTLLPLAAQPALAEQPDKIHPQIAKLAHEVDTQGVVALSSPGIANQGTSLSDGVAAQAGASAYDSDSWNPASWNSASENGAAWNSASWTSTAVATAFPD